MKFTLDYVSLALQTRKQTRNKNHRNNCQVDRIVQNCKKKQLILCFADCRIAKYRTQNSLRIMSTPSYYIHSVCGPCRRWEISSLCFRINVVHMAGEQIPTFLRVVLFISGMAHFDALVAFCYCYRFWISNLNLSTKMKIFVSVGTTWSRILVPNHW